VTDAPYVIGGYAVSTVAIGGYVLRMRLRRRALTGLSPSAVPATAASDLDGERVPERP